VVGAQRASDVGVHGVCHLCPRVGERPDGSALSQAEIFGKNDLALDDLSGPFVMLVASARATVAHGHDELPGHSAREAGVMTVQRLSGQVNRIIAWADRLQRRHGVLGFPYAVVKKYGDDEGGREAALITYYGFLSIFPLLLLGVAVLSRVLADHPDLRQRLLTAIVPQALRSTVEHSV